MRITLSLANFLPKLLAVAFNLVHIRDQSLLMVGGGAEDIEGGINNLYDFTGGPHKNSIRGGPQKIYTNIDKTAHKPVK